MHKIDCREGYINFNGVRMVKEVFQAIPVGCCLDCLDQGTVKPITWYCDGCGKAKICNVHDNIYELCKHCRH